MNKKIIIISLIISITGIASILYWDAVIIGDQQELIETLYNDLLLKDSIYEVKERRYINLLVSAQNLAAEAQQDAIDAQDLAVEAQDRWKMCQDNVYSNIYYNY